MKIVKISCLINRLLELQENHGDLDVLISLGDGYSFYLDSENVSWADMGDSCYPDVIKIDLGSSPSAAGITIIGDKLS